MPSSKKKGKNKQAPSKRRHAKAVSKSAQGKRGTKKKEAKKGRMKKAGSKAAPTSASRRKRRASIDNARELREEIQGKRRASGRSASRRSSQDFEGLSQGTEADSESVAELVEEGNVFEAGAVAGVEEADNADEREVRTHEVPEDDVPDEYLDKD